MLSRTADHLYWMSRYTERAENTARMLDVNYQTSLLPQSAAVSKVGWQGMLSISELMPAYQAKHGEVDPQRVMQFMVRDESNPSSIVSCLKAARENARAVRGSLTTEAWETQNQTWLEVNRMLRAGEFERDPGQFFEWVKYRSHLSRGVTVGTMLMDEALHFMRLGTFLERADNTSRILDVKYHILLPEFSGVGGGLDYHQWSAILRAVSALRAYHWVYNDRVQPWKVAELLILRPEMPRSLRSSFDHISEALTALSTSYNRTGECHRLAGQIHARLKYGKIDGIFQTGLHEFLTEIVDSTIELGNETARFYLF